MSAGILSDSAIRYAIDHGLIEIDPFDPNNINPVSVDLTLGDEVLVYTTWTESDVGRGLTLDTRPEPYVLDIREEPKTRKFKIGPEGFVVRPGIGYLMHTRERVHTKQYVPVLDGKSSIGRLFMVVHVTAGFGDPGFNGQYTLEVTVTHPLRIYPGMKIAQMRFHTIVGTVKHLYEGNYTGEAARGPVASRAYRQFYPKGDIHMANAKAAFPDVKTFSRCAHCGDCVPDGQRKMGTLCRKCGHHTYQSGQV